MVKICDVKQDKQQGKERETNYTYQFRNVSEDSKYKPNEPLKKKNLKNWKKLGQRESSRHLFPEKVGYTKGATTATTQGDQAGEYDWKQRYIGDDRGNETKCGWNDPVSLTGVLCRVPWRVNLRVGWAQYVKND